MQRWFFLEDNVMDDYEDVAVSSFQSKNAAGQNTEASSKVSLILTKPYTFTVIMNQTILPNEQLAITGNCSSLGDWELSKAILMTPISDTNNWIVNVEIPRDKDICYRYLVCALVPNTAELIVRNWETHKMPRIIPELAETSTSLDIYGDIDGIEKIDRGWLTNEIILQLKFFNSPFQWKQKMKNRLIYIKVTPMLLGIHSNDATATGNIPLQSTSSSLPTEDSLSNDTRENTDIPPPAFSFSEVVNLKYDESILKTQSQFGTPCGPDDLIIFHLTITDFANIAYLVDLYTYSSKAVGDEPPFHLGYHYILPNLLKRSEGKLDLPITCATKHRPLGMMQIGYLIIKPFKSYHFKTQRSYQRYWNKKWTGLDVGHRGSGTSFKTKDSIIRENTITSLKNAAEHGADMVEFDVQLSKDLVPVIYHDFHVYVTLKSKKTVNVNDFMELPMRELTLEQLKNFKVYHVAEGRSREPRNFPNDDLHEHQPFPQLADVLDAITSHVGFNIEIKWSQELIDGTTESKNHVDRNLYVDCILDVVLRKAGPRRIVFSCFDPDMCTMLRYKQNIYPVMFLTLGQTKRYTKYRDPRCNTIEMAVCNARAMELLGIVAHTEDLLRDPTQVNLATNRGLVVFCWGDDNNSKDTILQLKNMGLHAIIYDKMDVLTPKAVKESVFLVQARESQNDLFKIDCLERNRARARPNNDFQTDSAAAGQKVLNLDIERDKIVLSTATSLASLLGKDSD